MTATEPARAPTDPGLRAAVASEWMKLITLRSARVNLILGVVLGVAFSALLALTVALTFDEWAPSEQGSFNPTLYAMSGGLFTVIFFAAVGVNAFASEYSSGMIRLTLTATPRRNRVLAAKAISVAALTSLATLVAALGMFFASQAIFGANGLGTTAVTDPDTARLLGLTVLLGPLYPIIGLAFAVLMRSTAPALITTLALIFVPNIFGGLFPPWWQRNVISLLPGPASDSLTIGHLDDMATHLHPALAAVVVCVWLAGALAFAMVVFERRDS